VRLGTGAPGVVVRVIGVAVRAMSVMACAMSVAVRCTLGPMGVCP